MIVNYYEACDIIDNLNYNGLYTEGFMDKISDKIKGIFSKWKIPKSAIDGMSDADYNTLVKWCDTNYDSLDELAHIRKQQKIMSITDIGSTFLLVFSIPIGLYAPLWWIIYFALTAVTKGVGGQSGALRTALDRNKIGKLRMFERNMNDFLNSPQGKNISDKEKKKLKKALAKINTYIDDTDMYNF